MSSSPVIPISSPSAQGVSAAGISAFLEAIEADTRIEPHGLIIQRHGHRIAEGYWAPHVGTQSRLVYSLSKSFTGTALGLALDEGLLSLDDLVVDHLPEYRDIADERTARMKIRHIASMGSGHNREMLGEALEKDAADPVRGFLSIPPDAEPGSLFCYNQPPVMALGKILQRVTKTTLTEYLKPRILDPIGVSDFSWAQVFPGVDLAFSGVYTNLDAIAKLGQLYLDQGVVDGRQLVSSEWVADASRKHTDNSMMADPDWQQGYGFQLWVSQNGYRGDGAFGQYMVVLPEHDVVIAMFSATEYMQKIMNLIWKHLLPAFVGPGSASEDEALRTQLDSLALPTAWQRLGGENQRPSDQTLTPVATSNDHAIQRVTLANGSLVLHEDGGELTVSLSREWTTDRQVAVSSTSTNRGIVVDLILLASPHRMEITLDTHAGTFDARWLGVPLFGAGLSKRLHTIMAPPRLPSADSAR